MHAHDLDGLSRSDLIEKAESLGVEKAGLFTRAELMDEIVRRTVPDPIERRVARGLLGVARDLVARVVERGLHLPDAAARIRGASTRDSWTPAKPPIATVTLAEIYAMQGHRTRALSVLDEVLAQEEDHTAARELRDKIAVAAVDEPALPPEPEETSSSSSQIESSPVIATGAPDGEGRPIGMLDDVPLPEHYDVDEVVLMPVDPKTIFVTFAGKIFGGTGGSALNWLIALMLIVALALSALNAIMGCARSLHQMSVDGQFPRFFQKINKHGVPDRAMFFNVVASLIVILGGGAVEIYSFSNVGYTFSFLPVLVGYYLLRKYKPNARRPVRLPEYFKYVALGMAVLYFVIWLYGGIMYSKIGHTLVYYLAGWGVLIAYLPLYWYRVKVEDKRQLPEAPAPVPTS